MIEEPYFYLANTNFTLIYDSQVLKPLISETFSNMAHKATINLSITV